MNCTRRYNIDTQRLSFFAVYSRTIGLNLVHTKNMLSEFVRYNEVFQPRKANTAGLVALYKCMPVLKSCYNTVRKATKRYKFTVQVLCQAGPHYSSRSRIQCSNCTWYRSCRHRGPTCGPRHHRCCQGPAPLRLPRHWSFLLLLPLLLPLLPQHLCTCTYVFIKTVTFAVHCYNSSLDYMNNI